jgi:ribosomal protein L20A (L18A)
MRTTIDIDDQLLKYAKLQAAQQGSTLRQVIEDALREFFSRHSLERNPVKLETVSGARLKPGVNLDDGRSLNDIMEGR